MQFNLLFFIVCQLFVLVSLFPSFQLTTLEDSLSSFLFGGNCMECQFFLFCNFKLLSILGCSHEKLINSEIQFLKALPFTEFAHYSHMF